MGQNLPHPDILKLGINRGKQDVYINTFKRSNNVIFYNYYLRKRINTQ